MSLLAHGIRLYTNLQAAGFGPSFLSQLDLQELETLFIARVLFASRSFFQLWTPEGERAASAVPWLDAHVAVGDWVLVAPGDPPRITRCLERRSAVRRRDPHLGVQVVGANIDLLWICTSIGLDLNVRRIERYLVLAADAGVEPVVVLTKAESDTDAARALLAPVLGSTPVYVTSALTSQGLDALTALLTPGCTVAMVGSSGVGKSTLANALLGEDRMLTGGIRDDDGKGRHTTTARHLIRLANGAWLLDNPGIRQVGVVDETSVNLIFPEVEAAVARCKFRDCGHDTEPGCGVHAALDAGEIEPERFAAWQKLQRELAYVERQFNPHAARAERERWKRIHKQQRQRGGRGTD